ncbi:MAG: hypothetical protein ACYDEX_19515, partial [Mobilitalea sp.]
ELTPTPELPPAPVPSSVSGSAIAIEAGSTNINLKDLVSATSQNKIIAKAYATIQVTFKMNKSANALIILKDNVDWVYSTSGYNDNTWANADTFKTISIPVSELSATFVKPDCGIGEFTLQFQEGSIALDEVINYEITSIKIIGADASEEEILLAALGI